MKYFILLLVTVSLFAGSISAQPQAPSASIPIVIAVVPQFHGDRFGFTGKSWEPKGEEIDFNQLIAETLTKGLKHVPPLTLVQSFPTAESFVSIKDAATLDRPWLDQLDKLAQQLSADELLVIQFGA